VNGGTIEEVGQSFGFRMLALAKIVISGFALIYMVLIGVYMVVFSENEEKVKTQRKQIVYTLIGFLFLNIPGLIYEVMSPAAAGGKSITL
jgi:glucose uptake protein GlcU